MKQSTIKNRNTILEACINGNIEFITYKMNRNIKFDFFNNYGETPLILASINNQNEIVNKICDYKNNNIDFIDNEGYTALYYSVQNNNYQNVKKLLESGANYNIILTDGITVMSHAYMMEYNNIIKLLYDFGDIVPNNYLGLTRKKPKKSTPPKLTDPFILSIRNNNKDDILKYLNEGYNINQRFYPDNSTPIIYAIEIGNFETIKFLCDNGAEPSLKNIYGMDAYLIADFKDDKIIINYLNSIKKI